MKFLAVMLLSAAVSGCSTHQTITFRADPMDRCSTIAEQRADDGASNGYDQNLQKSVYRDTYADCVKWDAKYDGIRY